MIDEEVDVVVCMCLFCVDQEQKQGQDNNRKEQMMVTVPHLIPSTNCQITNLQDVK